MTAMAEAKKSDKTKNKKVKETQENQTDKKTESEKPEEAEKETNSDGEKDSLDSEIENIRNQLSQVNDKLLRTLAEYDNYRKRTQKEKEAIYSDSKSEIVMKLLPVIDNFERAEKTEQPDFETYKKGIDMIFTQLTEAMKSLGVESFGETGDGFDPNMHNGVMHIDDENLGENVIADVFMKGYKMGDKVLRPATVKVAN